MLSPPMAETRRHNWTFLTNHAAVLVCIAGNPESRIEDIAATVGISRRAAQMIVGDLVADGYLERRRIGRRNQYRVHADMPLRRKAFRDQDVRGLLALIGR